MNGFPSKVINTTIRNVTRKKEEDNRSQVRTTGDNPNPDIPDIMPFICLPCKGKVGDKLLSQFRDAISKALPTFVKPRFAYKGKTLGSYFRLKDKVPLDHQTDLVYAFRHDDSTKYVGETNVRFASRTHEHCVTDKKSSVHKFKIENQLEISQRDFQILDKGYTRKINRKLAEALYIKELKPALNEQVKSYKLILFN